MRGRAAVVRIDTEFGVGEAVGHGLEVADPATESAAFAGVSGAVFDQPVLDTEE